MKAAETHEPNQGGSEPGTCRRSRWVYALATAVVFGIGVASRTVDVESVLLNKYLGDALYAVLFYLALGVCFPHHRLRSRLVTSGVFVLSVECFQLTGIPLELRQQGGFAQLLSICLGTKFAWLDIVAYFVGLACVATLDGSQRK